jgi:hypothetical protein
MESWLRSAPGFEGEVVKRMVTSIAHQVSSVGAVFRRLDLHWNLHACCTTVQPPAQRSAEETGSKERVKTPEMAVV